MKVCCLCGETKPYDAFHAMRGMKDGYRNECKECLKPLRRAWYDANKEKAVQAAKEWQERNPERVEAYRKRVPGQA